MPLAKRLHAPGNCPDRLYGQNCDGIGHYRTDPYAVEINNDYTKSWICDGVEYGSAQDI